MGCSARDWANFLRVDDEGNEIVPTIQDKPNSTTKKDLIYALDELIRKIEEMPPNAMVTMINHYDYLTLLVWLSSWLRVSDKEFNCDNT